MKKMKTIEQIVREMIREKGRQWTRLMCDDRIIDTPAAGEGFYVYWIMDEPQQEKAAKAIRGGRWSSQWKKLLESEEVTWMPIIGGADPSEVTDNWDIGYQTGMTRFGPFRSGELTFMEAFNKVTHNNTKEV